MEDLAWPQGQPNMGGLVGELFVAAIDDVDPALTGLTINADGVTVDGNIALLALKKFGKLYQTRGAGKLDENTVGDRDGKSFENMAEFFFPGMEKAVAAWKAKYVNTPCLAIVKETSGTYRIFGISILGGALSLDLPAYIESVAGTTGAASADRRGSTFQIKSEAPHPPLYYGGTIDIDAST